MPGERAWRRRCQLRPGDGVTKDLGIIAAGRLADMILIDGDPAKNIRDTRNITTVIKGGKVYDPVAIEKALGIAPRSPRR